MRTPRNRCRARRAGPLAALLPTSWWLAWLLAAGCGRSIPPNLVLVSVDTLRADHLGAYGYARDTSPFLDRLAGEGTLFETAMSTTSWTLPSHLALMTGVPDPVHGVVFDQRSLRPEIPLLAETLRRAGYHTTGFYTGPYLHPVFGFGRGFDLYESCMSQDTFYDAPSRGAAGSPFALQDLFQRKEAEAHRDVTTGHVVRRVREWLETNPPEPFFLFLHLFDVHHDYLPPPPFDTRFLPGSPQEEEGDDALRRRARAAGVDPGELARIVALYDGEIAWVDQGIARIHTALREAGHLEDAIWIVTADHGEEFYEHGKKGHRQDLEEEVLHVPLLFWGPGRIARERRVSGVVSTVDLTPTILDLAGVPPGGARSNRSWLSWLRPRGGRDHVEGGEAFASLYFLGATAPRRRFWHALRTDRFAIIESGGLPPGGGDLPDLRDLVAQKTQLRDLRRDPRDPAASRGAAPPAVSSPLREEAMRRLRARIDLLQRARDALPAQGPAPVPDLRAIEERLRQLGYR